MKQIFKQLVLFFIGGGAYFLLEIMFRGRSHWTMFILGGLCFWIIGLLNEVFTWEFPLLFQGITGSLVITASEMIVGYIVNIKLDWGIWDYSDMPCNICGQICLPFSIVWVVLSVLAVFIDDYLRHKLFYEEEPHYIWFRKEL